MCSETHFRAFFDQNQVKKSVLVPYSGTYVGFCVYLDDIYHNRKL